jgi:hypothetical protein
MAAAVRHFVRCGHCYRPATATVYRRTLLRRFAGLPAERFVVCGEHLRSYSRPSRWRRDAG